MSPSFFKSSNRNDFNQNDSVIECSSASQLVPLSKVIAQRIEQHGFCLINAWDSSEQTLKMISNQFGNVQFHIRANENGVAGEGESQSTQWESYKQEYAGVGREEFYPHTDGSFLNGMMVEQEFMQSIRPPKLILLQCAKQAANGGQNYLVDGRRILEDLLDHHPGVLSTLFSPGCITFCRDDLLAPHLSVYEMVGKQINLRFRYDFATYVPSWSLPIVKKLHYDYHLNPKYRILIDLQPNQILVVDNLRMLHARTAFNNSVEVGERKLRRTWIFDDKAPRLHNVTGKPRQHRATLPFMNYHRGNRSLFSQYPSISPKVGIHLASSKLQKLFSVMNTLSSTVHTDQEKQPISLLSNVVEQCSGKVCK